MRISLEGAARLLNHNDVVAIPTETVYGLAAYLHSEQAVEKIFRLKKRPKENPLIIHVKDAAQALSFVQQQPPHLQELMERFWPGPLTIILPIHEHLIPNSVRANLPTAAFRSPNHPLLHDLLELISPVVAPSANISGKPSGTKYEHIETDFGGDFPVLDGGPCTHGLESTIIAYINNRWMLARHGAVSQEKLQEVIGYMPEPMPTQEKPISPGQLFRHYAPQAHLYLDSPNHKVVAMIGFSDRIYPEGVHVYHLGKSTDPDEVSHRLYAILRQLDIDQITEAVVDMNFPRNGVWNTIYERIKKAASKT